MKITTMQTNGNRQAGGFTLIEMIGVLAVIAILAALLLPKVANAINDSKINSAVGSYQTVCTAVTGFYTKNVAFNMTNNPPATVASTLIPNYDINALVLNGYLDHPFSVKVGTNATVSCTTGYTTTPGIAGLCNGGAGYILTGSGGPTTTNMQYVVECVISGVSPQDANAISTLVDGPTMTSTVGTADLLGKVTYDGSNVVHMFVDGR